MLPVEKNKEYELEITSVTSECSGVGNINGYTVFVPGTVRGDIVKIETEKTKSRYGIGSLKRIIKPSPYRTEPLCAVYDKCGGCGLMHMKYEEQLFVKQNIVKDALFRIGGFKDFETENICGADEPYRYRNKIVFQMGENLNHGTVCGFYENKSHNVISVCDCLIGDEKNKEIVNAVLQYMKKNNLSAYDEKSGKGSIRGIFIRKSFSENDIMAVIRAVTNKLPKLNELAEGLTAAGVGNVILNVSRRDSGIIESDKNTVLFGEGYITDRLLGVKFKISPESFFQINPVMTERLYNKALEYADLSGSETVMDIYCGIGTISLCAAKRAKSVTGIEIVERAVRDAEENRKLNGIENASFFAGSAQNLVPMLIDKGLRPDVVILDPPRKGSDEKTLNAIINAAPKRIVYISCDPATLARDLRFVCGRGYRLDKAAPFDMFPQTGHVETVCLLSKLHSDQHIEVELEMDELDLTAAESKATYEEIKDYVLKQSGLKVSNLYIAQVKQKCGIIERVNYNLPKSENSRQPKCPPEKEAAIREALEHFRMI